MVIEITNIHDWVNDTIEALDNTYLITSSRYFYNVNNFRIFFLYSGIKYTSAK